MDDTIGEEDVGRASSDYMIEGQLNQLGIPDTPEWVESEVVPEAPEAFADPSILEDQTYVREYGTKFEPDPYLRLIGGDRAYKKLTTNEERLNWLDKKIKMAESPGFQGLGEVWETQEWIDQMEGEKERVLEYVGQFQTGGVIPKGKVGLAGEGSAPESVGGQMLEGPTLVSGGEKGTRVKRETPIRRNEMMASLSSALGEAPPDPRDIPRGPYNPPPDPSTADQPKWFSKSPFFKDTPNPWWKNELFDNIPAGPPSHLPEGSSGYNVVAKVFDKRRKKAKKAIGWDIGPLTAGMLWAARTMMSRRVKAHEELGFDAGSLSKGNLWRAKVMQKREAAGGTKGQIWQAKTMAKRAGDSENWKNYIMETVMVDTGIHGKMKETLPKATANVQTGGNQVQLGMTIVGAGRVGSKTITVQTNVDTSSTWSSRSGSTQTTQQGFSINNNHTQPPQTGRAA
tara:strand:+ start:1 stop:1365 length:1365 start_codon:yes stop_codon:yes gene_type:complete